MNNIWLITVNYGETSPTVELVNSIEEANHKNEIKIFIADNKSSKKSKKQLLSLKKNSVLDIKLFFNKKNYFYWPAANKILLNEFKLKSPYPDWIIICNNDIIFQDKNFFSELNKIDNKKFHIIGPTVSSDNHKDLNPFLQKELSLFQILYWNVYFKSYLLASVLNFLKKIRFDNKKTKYKIKKVYAVHGSAIIFSKNFFEKKGKLDNNFKLYCEELTTAEIAKSIGCNTYHYKDLKILHKEHFSTKKNNKKELYSLARESHFYFVNNYLKK